MKRISLILFILVLSNFTVQSYAHYGNTPKDSTPVVPSDFKKSTSKKEKALESKIKKHQDNDATAKELELGLKASKFLIARYGYYSNPEVNQYVKQLGQSIVKKVAKRDLEYHFYILDTDEINAFALPGGIIFVTKGILKVISNEAELVAVLCHEIAHVEKKHYVRKMNDDKKMQYQKQRF